MRPPSVALGLGNGERFFMARQGRPYGNKVAAVKPLWKTGRPSNGLGTGKETGAAATVLRVLPSKVTDGGRLPRLGVSSAFFVWHHSKLIPIIKIMMKLSQLIQKLQQFQAEHGDVDFCVEATGRADDDGEICTVIGNEFVSLDFEKDSQEGDWGCLVTETKYDV